MPFLAQICDEKVVVTGSYFSENKSVYEYLYFFLLVDVAFADVF